MQASRQAENISDRCFCNKGVHKVRTLFWTNFDPHVTHLGTPLKYVAHLGNPQFLVVRAYIYVFTGRFVLVRGRSCLVVFSAGFCLEGFVRGGFCPSSFYQNTSVTTES